MWSAVVFDLFGTLTEPTRAEIWDEMALATAKAVNSDPLRIRQISDATVSARMRGELGDAWQATTAIVHLAGRPANKVAIDRAVRARLEVLRSVMPTKEALRVLKALRGVVRLAVLSNCLPETSILWPSMGLDELVDFRALSCEIRCMKPEPASFQYVLEALDNGKGPVLYVSDGDATEVLAAQDAGMTPLLLAASNTADGLDTRNIRQIEALSELLSIVRRGSLN